MTFEEAYVLHHQDIRRLSWKCVIPGMDSDDIESEMLIVLWKAVETFDPLLGSLWGRFWTMWNNRRKNLLKAFFADCRPSIIYTDTMPEPEAVANAYIPIPSRLTPDQHKVWMMLSDGDTAKEIKHDLGLSQRTYYGIIRGWRTDDVVDLLT